MDESKKKNISNTEIKSSAFKGSTVCGQKKCRPLYEYSWFIQKIKEYMAVEKNLDKALTQTIEDCEREGIMVDFVRKHGSEAVDMLFTQWNMEDALEVRYEEGFEDGFEDGELFALVKLVNPKYPIIFLLSLSATNTPTYYNSYKEPRKLPAA